MPVNSMTVNLTNARDDAWWFHRLNTRLRDKRRHLDLMDRWRSGNQPPPVPVSDETREAWEQFQRRGRSGAAALAVRALANGLSVSGVTLPGSSDPDNAAAEVWRRSKMGSRERPLYRAKVGLSEAYTIVGDRPDANGVPVITVEDPRSVITESDPVNLWDVRAGLKVWTEDRTEHAVLYMPTYYRELSHNGATWEWRDGGPQHYRSMTRVPVTWYPNDLGLDRSTRTIFEHALPTLERLDTMLLQRLVIVAMQAFRQRAIEGLPEKDEDGKPIDYSGVFAADPAALWQLPAGVKIHELAAGEIANILSAAKDDLQEFAAELQMPLPFFVPEANQSAEGAALQKLGWNAQGLAQQTEIGVSHSRTLSLALEWMGHGANVEPEIVWHPFHQPSTGDMWNAANIALSHGMPWALVATELLGVPPAKALQYAAGDVAAALAPPITGPGR